VPGATPEEAIARIRDAVNLWRLSAANTGEVIDAAVACLVAEVDSPTLRELAGASPRDSQFELEPMIESTLQELGLEDVLTVGPQRGALAAMIRRFKDGELSAREPARWAHTYMGHDGDDSCQVFVDLDDMYDTADYSDYGAGDLDRWTAEEADAFLEGKPSPGRTEVWRPPQSPAAMILGQRRWRKRFKVRITPGGREFWARRWDDLWGSLPEMGVPWRSVSFESEGVRTAVLKAWGKHPDSPGG
jgi:hypothetical protein